MQDDAALRFVSGVCREGFTKWDFSKSHLRLLTGLKELQDEAALLFVSSESSTEWNFVQSHVSLGTGLKELRDEATAVCVVRVPPNGISLNLN